MKQFNKCISHMKYFLVPDFILPKKNLQSNICHLNVFKQL